MSTTSIIIRDQYGIHPDDAEFVKEKLREIAEHFRRFKFLEMSATERACLIGQALNELQPKIFKGQWENFCRDHFDKFSARSTRYKWMQLATFRPALLKYSIHEHPRTETTQDVTASESITCDEKEVHDINSSEPTTYAAHAELPNIETSLKLIQKWMAKHQGKNRSTPKKSEPREYCPHCGQFLSKRVKSWMKQHSVKR